MCRQNVLHEVKTNDCIKSDFKKFEYKAARLSFIFGLALKQFFSKEKK
jgi:hypothetical protein